MPSSVSHCSPDIEHQQHNFTPNEANATKIKSTHREDATRKFVPLGTLCGSHKIVSENSPVGRALHILVEFNGIATSAAILQN